MKPPAHLSDRSKALWERYVPSRFRTPGPLALFRMGLEAMDRADAARERIDADGLVLINTTTGVGHAHPALKVEKDAWAMVLRVWAVLGLNREVPAAPQALTEVSA